MAKNYLKGFIGDEINLLLAASAFNLKKWMNNFILFFIALRVAVIIYALREETPNKREKYLQLFLLLLKLWQKQEAKITALVDFWFFRGDCLFKIFFYCLLQYQLGCIILTSNKTLKRNI